VTENASYQSPCFAKDHFGSAPPAEALLIDELLKVRHILGFVEVQDARIYHGPYRHREANIDIIPAVFCRSRPQNPLAIDHLDPNHFIFAAAVSGHVQHQSCTGLSLVRSS